MKRLGILVLLLSGSLAANADSFTFKKIGNNICKVSSSGDQTCYTPINVLMEKSDAIVFDIIPKTKALEKLTNSGVKSYDEKQSAAIGGALLVDPRMIKQVNHDFKVLRVRNLGLDASSLNSTSAGLPFILEVAFTDANGKSGATLIQGKLDLTAVRAEEQTAPTGRKRYTEDEAREQIYKMFVIEALAGDSNAEIPALFQRVVGPFVMVQVIMDSFKQNPTGGTFGTFAF